MAQTVAEYNRRYQERHGDRIRARRLARDAADPARARAGHRKQYERVSARNAALKDRPCMDCGGTFPTECMDFDHVRGEKMMRVSSLARASDARIAAEIAKCDLVCANCHRTRTKRRRVPGERSSRAVSQEGGVAWQ